MAFNEGIEVIELKEAPILNNFVAFEQIFSITDKLVVMSYGYGYGKSTVLK